MLVIRLTACAHLRHFQTQPLFSGPAGLTPLEFREDLDIPKTRMNGLSCGKAVSYTHLTLPTIYSV